MTKRWGIVLALGAALVLSGCASPGLTDDEKLEAASALMQERVVATSGESIAAAYAAGDIFSGIATDLLEGCGKVGMPEAYAAQIPDLEDAIIEAYAVTCPE